MPLDNSALNLMATALDNAITHARLHSADPGTTEANSVGSARVAASFTPNAAGVLTLDAAVNFTGITANGPVLWVTLWSASSTGTRYGKFLLTGDTTANAAGEYSLTALTITPSTT